MRCYFEEDIVLVVGMCLVGVFNCCQSHQTETYSRSHNKHDHDHFRNGLLFTQLFYSDHIFEKVNPAMEALGLECSCLGGGKIEHNNTEKKLRVFGESTVTTLTIITTT